MDVTQNASTATSVLTDTLKYSNTYLLNLLNYLFIYLLTIRGRTTVLPCTAVFCGTYTVAQNQRHRSTLYTTCADRQMRSRF